ncbi:hypothetical protein BD289DRAFT_295017 [Coniella lustricola]|uniref:Uncharacterized protein n=1 Tax=Coniella lustricola TaxID=2025994 RepID=A0A2T3A4Z4_9PEZI|nr:hypothetical protein BD289DRAFT_295017 [Coniella lustricola]
MPCTICTLISAMIPPCSSPNAANRKHTNEHVSGISATCELIFPFSSFFAWEEGRKENLSPPTQTDSRPRPRPPQVQAHKRRHALPFVTRNKPLRAVKSCLVFKRNSPAQRPRNQRQQLANETGIDRLLWLQSSRYLTHGQEEFSVFRDPPLLRSESPHKILRTPAEELKRPQKGRPGTPSGAASSYKGTWFYVH